jgi:hypothetical protein
VNDVVDYSADIAHNQRQQENQALALCRPRLVRLVNRERPRRPKAQEHNDFKNFSFHKLLSPYDYNIKLAKIKVSHLVNTPTQIVK